MELCDQEVSDQKKIVYLRKQEELNQIRYIIILKVKRVCRLDQNTVTMALRRVFYSLSLSTTTLTHAGFYTRILINSNTALASYQY